MRGEEGTLADAFLAQVARGPERPALRFRRGDRWVTKTWGEWRDRAREIAAALVALGVGPGERVGVLSQTRVEWAEVDAAAWLASVVSVPVQTALLGETVRLVFERTRARVVFVDDPAQLEKLVGPSGRLPPSITDVVLLDASVRLDAPDERGRLSIAAADVWPPSAGARLHAFDAFCALGASRLHGDDAPPGAVAAELEARRRALRPTDLATLVTTSGTTGDPRAVRLSHAALWAEGALAAEALGIRGEDEQLLFLPLAHVLGRLTLLAQLHAGHVTAFGAGMLSIQRDLEEVRPTLLVSVPRLYEKIHGLVTHAFEDAGDMRRRVFQWSLAVGRRVSQLERAGRRAEGLLAVERRYADRLVFQAIHRRLGGRIRLLVSGGAALPAHVAEFFHAAGLLVLEGYGLTETSGAAVVNRPGAYRFGSVGLPLRGVEVRLGGDGELLLRGPTLFDGYDGDDEASRAAIDEHGFFRTGDLGRVDADGFVYVTGRKKELLVTAGGRNLAPQRIERALERSPLIARAFVLGDGRPYPVALLVLEPGAGGLHRDDPALRAAVDRAVAAANETLAGFERIRRYAILDDPPTVASGELSPKLEPRRDVIARVRADVLAALYA